MLKLRICGELRSAVGVVRAIHRAPCVAVQPRSVAAECNQISERELVVVEVAHGGDITPSLTVGLLPRCHNGIFPCFFGGFLSRLFSSNASARISLGLVWAGSIT